MKIGFIGLGAMGRPMASNLARKGFELVVHDTRREPVEALVALGAKPANGAAGVAQACDIVATMLPDPADVEAVVLAPGGVLENARPGALLLDMSTVDRRSATPKRLRSARAFRSPCGSRSISSPRASGRRAAPQPSRARGATRRPTARTSSTRWSRAGASNGADWAASPKRPLSPTFAYLAPSDRTSPAAVSSSAGRRAAAIPSSRPCSRRAWRPGSAFRPFSPRSSRPSSRPLSSRPSSPAPSHRRACTA